MHNNRRGQCTFFSQQQKFVCFTASNDINPVLFEFDRFTYFTMSRVCFCSYFLVFLERSLHNSIFVQYPKEYLGVSVVLTLIRRVAFSHRSLTRRPEAKQNKTHNLTLLLPLPMFLLPMPTPLLRELLRNHKAITRSHTISFLARPVTSLLL